MTDGIVSAVVKKLADLLINEAQSLHRVGCKIDEVKLQLDLMQNFLEDVDSKKKKGDKRIEGWVHNLRNLTYETEDAIDTFLVEANYRWLGLIPNGLLACHTLGGKISKIQTKLRIISDGRTTFGIQDLSGDQAGHSESLLQKQPSFKRRVLPDVDNIEVVGFDAEKRDIINLLLHGTSSQSRHVVSIVGPSGLGKTTLAQKVYSCPMVLGVLKELELQQEDQIVFLLGELHVLLREKKYLIVLDDVWAENAFTQLETGLVDVGNGSRVLMTTRNLNVANRADSIGVYTLRFLNKEESFGLFLKKAFPSSDPSPECPDELLDVTRKLVKRCGGLPLTLTVLGGLLSRKSPTYQEWSRVFNRLDWHEVEGGECMKILATSYDDLSYLHKSCFRYLACFPEDYKIKAKRLMKIWIAEGLIEVKKEGEFEDYAEDYLEELVKRCLVQVVERDFCGAIKSIQVHDLLREVALVEATENDFLLIWKEENAKRDVSMTRRVTFHNEIHPMHLTKIKMPNLRTFINFGGGSVGDIGFLLLRVLELRYTSIRYLPTDLKNMIHLRYLGLRRTTVPVIPSWIGHLLNLQTFDIRNTRVKQLPKSLWKITSLRHVHSTPYLVLVGPPSTANLINLRSLGWCKVPKSWKKSIPYLLGICKLQLFCDDENDLLSVGLINLGPPRGMIDFSTSPSYQNIHTMELNGGSRTNYDTAYIGIAEMPPNLSKLTLFYYNLNYDLMPKLERLSSLKFLKLCFIYLNTDTIVCTYEGFPWLQNLILDLVNNIKEWKVEYGALPVLKYLSIVNCRDLHTLPDVQCVTTLQELKIGKRLYSKIENKSGEEWDKVKHIPTIDVTRDEYAEWSIIPHYIS